MLTLAIVGVVSAALIGGAVLGLYGPLPKPAEGFVVALAGGALILSVVLELIDPSAKQTSPWFAVAFVAVGAGVFTFADWLINEKWGGEGGPALLAAVTLDGVPENLALGVTLISAGPLQAAALAGSIFLSNLPEAAGGAKRMAANGKLEKRRILYLWVATAVLLGGAAMAGNLLLGGASEQVLAAIKCFAGGAVVASLSTAVFPQAFREDNQLAGLATALGLMLALLLNGLGGGG